MLDLNYFNTSYKQMTYRTTLDEDILSYWKQQGGQDLNLLDHRVDLRDLQQQYNYCGEKGLTQQYVEENRLISKEIPFRNMQDNLNSRQEIRLVEEGGNHNFLLHYKLCALTAGAIFFIAFIEYSDDLSYLTTGLLLMLIVFLWCGVDYSKRRKYFNFRKKVLKLIPKCCDVIRDGIQLSINSDDVVVGDVIVLTQDSIVAVDCRVISIDYFDDGLFALIADTESVFGKKIFRKMTTTCTDPTNQMHSLNVMLQGFIVFTGSGLAIALHNKEDSFLNRISNRVENERLLDWNKSINVELRQYVTRQSWVSMFFGVISLIVTRFLFNYNLLRSSIVAAYFIIAILPTGLLTIIWFARLIMLFKRKRKNYKFSKYLSVSYGECPVICSDFDIITRPQSKKSLKSIWINNQQDDASNLISEKSHLTLLHFHTCVLSTWSNSFEDQALLHFFQAISDRISLQDLFQSTINESGNSASIHSTKYLTFQAKIMQESTLIGDFVLYIQGDPCKIWMACTTIEIEGSVVQINGAISQSFMNALTTFSFRGEKSIAFARLELPRNQYQPGFSNMFFDEFGRLLQSLNNLTFISLVSFEIPVFQLRNFNLHEKKLILMSRSGIHNSLALAHASCMLSSIPSDLCLSENQLHEYGNSDVIILDSLRVLEIFNKYPELGSQKMQEWTERQICIFSKINQEIQFQLFQQLQSLGYNIVYFSNSIEDIQLIVKADTNISSSQSSHIMQAISDLQVTHSICSSPLENIVESMVENVGQVENMRKIFVYTASLKMAHIIPVLLFLLLGIPFPISAIFMLLSSSILSVFPALTFLGEPIKIDQPIPIGYPHERNRVAIQYLICYSYIFLGVITCAAGLICFLTTLNHFGFPPSSLTGLATFQVYPFVDPNFSSINAQIPTYLPTQPLQNTGQIVNASTILDPSMPQWNRSFMTDGGNCNSDIERYGLITQNFDWFNPSLANKDLRPMLVFCDSDNHWKSKINWSSCILSPQSVCYTMEAFHFGQTSYFFGLIVSQISNLFALKSLRRSIFLTPFNLMMVLVPIIQIILPVLLVFTPWMQSLLRTRTFQFLLWGIPAIPFSIFILCFQEFTKVLQRVILFQKNSI